MLFAPYLIHGHFAKKKLCFDTSRVSTFLGVLGRHLHGGKLAGFHPLILFDGLA